MEYRGCSLSQHCQDDGDLLQEHSHFAPPSSQHLLSWDPFDDGGFGRLCFCAADGTMHVIVTQKEMLPDDVLDGRLHKIGTIPVR